MKIYHSDKARITVLPYGGKTVKPFSSKSGTCRTDGRTDRIAISISRVSMHDA